MVAPAVAGGLIKGAFGLLGGLFGSRSKRKAQARQNWYNHPVNVRKRAEQAGYNPLLFVGPGVGQQTQSDYSPMMGNAISQAGAAYADGKSEQQQLEMQKAELEMENQRLDQLVKSTTLRANVGGIYGQRQGKAGVFQPDMEPDTAGVRGDTLRASRLAGGGIANKYDDNVKAPALTVGGINLHGSGAISSGQTIEDAIGDGPLSWLAAPLIMSDMIGHSIGNYQSRKEQARADEAMGEWFRRVRENDPIDHRRFPENAPWLKPLYKRHNY